MKRYKDFYGCVATIKERGGRVHLTIKTSGGKLVMKNDYATERGAKIAMGKAGDCWEVIE